MEVQTVSSSSPLPLVWDATEAHFGIGNKSSVPKLPLHTCSSSTLAFLSLQPFFCSSLCLSLDLTSSSFWNHFQDFHFTSASTLMLAAIASQPWASQVNHIHVLASQHPCSWCGAPQGPNLWDHSGLYGQIAASLKFTQKSGNLQWGPKIHSVYT